MRIVLAGALGEVGRSLREALIARGHDVFPASSRAPIADAPDVLGLTQVGALIAAAPVDALVHAGGPGDHRTGRNGAHQWTRDLLAACADLPAVLVSTTRVLEGYSQTPLEGSPGNPSTAYGQANADHEQLWLSNANTRILRMVNYFCPPADSTSPQASLLPWSLLLEGWQTGKINVRSGGSTVREFIDSGDAARAVETLIDEAPVDRVVVAAPGLVATLEQLVRASIRACEAAGRKDVTATFGEESSGTPWRMSPGWLTQQGWSHELTLDRMTKELSRWLVEWASTIPDSGRDRG